MEIPFVDHAAMVGRTRSRPPKRQAQRKLFLGPWIRALGRKQVEIVRKTGINEGYLSQLISGEKTNPSADVVMEIADFLGIPMQYLYRPPPDREFLAEASKLDMAVLQKIMEHKP